MHAERPRPPLVERVQAPRNVMRHALVAKPLGICPLHSSRTCDDAGRAAADGQKGDAVGVPQAGQQARLLWAGRQGVGKGGVF